MTGSPVAKCRVIWARPDGERIIISQHASREGAQRVINLVKHGCESSAIYIEPKLPEREVPIELASLGQTL